MLHLLTDSTQKQKLEKINGTLIIFLNKPEFSLATKTILLLLKMQNTATLQQVTCGKTIDLVLKKMLETFLKIHVNIRISILKRSLQNFKKENFKPEIKPIIENLQDEL